MSAVYDRTIKALRHAWLNLLDKCMTTGRINQINIDKLHQYVYKNCDIISQSRHKKKIGLVSWKYITLFTSHTSALIFILSRHQFLQHRKYLHTIRSPLCNYSKIYNMFPSTFSVFILDKQENLKMYSNMSMHQYRLGTPIF